MTAVLDHTATTAGVPAAPDAASVARLLAVDAAGRAVSLIRLDDHLAWHGRLPVVPRARRGRPGPLADLADTAGLRGRGGGWFPAARKMRAVVTAAASRRSPAARVPVVIANGMEGEPASGKDAVLLSRSPHLVLDGLELAARTIGAREAYLVVHAGSPVFDPLVAAVEERRAAGVGGVRVRVAEGPARYVASEESALAHWVGDGLATPTSGPRPFQRGVRGRPTLVQNVETLAHLALVARHGAAWFRSVGTADAPGTTLVSVGGAVATPGVVEVAVGTPVRAVLARCGGPVATVRAFLTGGYGGAWVGATDLLDRSWSPEDVKDAGGVIGASILWALPEGSRGLAETAAVAGWMAGESAGQCGPCRFGLPSVSDDLTLLATGRARESDVRRLRTRLGLVSGRGACRHPDGTARLVATALDVFADEVADATSGRIAHPLPPRGLLPVPAARPAPVGPPGKDFR